LSINRFLRVSSKDRKLQKAIKNLFGFYPRNLYLFKLALCHKSAPSEYLDDAGINNERLEYLGDAVLSSLVADYLYKRFPTKDEGFLTEIRARIVSRSNLNRLGRKLGLQNLIFPDGKQKTKSKSIYGDTFEAVVGAIYLDQGYPTARKVVLTRIIDIHLDMDSIEKQDINFKSKLLEWSQKEKKDLEFKVLDELGEGYGKQYLVEVYIDDEPFARSQDFSIKGAEQRAAELTCEMLFNGDMDD
jgi:ribonuclease-3